MKKLKLRSHLYTLLVGVLFTGCVEKQSKEEQSKNEGIIVYDFHLNKKIRIFEVDSCEYITYDTSFGTSIIHKQNCKFCLERK